MFFMSDAALENMRTAKGFEIGADPNIVIVDAGAAKEISTSTVQADVYGYVFNQKGLMGGVAVQGLKISKTER
jgi:lipid-binding SYLF domain-containing protein